MLVIHKRILGLGLPNIRSAADIDWQPVFTVKYPHFIPLLKKDPFDIPYI